MDLLQSIMELGKQINGLQRPADLPPPGQSLPLETELESEVCSFSMSWTKAARARSCSSHAELRGCQREDGMTAFLCQPCQCFHMCAEGRIA